MCTLGPSECENFLNNLGKRTIIEALQAGLPRGSFTDHEQLHGFWRFQRILTPLGQTPCSEGLFILHTVGPYASVPELADKSPRRGAQAHLTPVTAHQPWGRLVLAPMSPSLHHCCPRPSHGLLHPPCPTCSLQYLFPWLQGAPSKP